MPKQPPRICSQRGCKAYSYDGSNYCAKHKPEQKTGWDGFRKKHGSSRHKAGYGHKWDKLRERILIRDRHLCQECLRLGIFTQAKHVDHILNKANGGTDDEHNLESLCRKCHQKKTNREALEARR